MRSPFLPLSLFRKVSLPLIAAAISLWIHPSTAFAQDPDPSDSPVVGYNPSLVQIQDQFPFTRSYTFSLISPANQPAVATNISFQITTNGVPSGVADGTALSYIAVSPSVVSFNGPLQERLVTVTMTMPAGAVAGAYGYKILSTGWPVDPAVGLANLGTFINATVTAAALPTPPPTIAISTPAQGATINTQSFPLTVPLQFVATVTGQNPPPITSVDAKLDGASIVLDAVSGLNSTAVNGTASLVITAPGIHSVRAEATNAAGTAVALHTFTVALTAPSPLPPTVGIATPTDGQIITVQHSSLDAQGRAAVPLIFTATAPVGYPITQVEWDVDGGPAVVQTGLNHTLVTTTGTMLVTAGAHSVNVRAHNAVDSDEDSNQFTVRVTGAPPPIVAISQPALTVYKFLKRAIPANDPYLVPFAFTAQSVANGSVIRSVVATLNGSSTPLTLTTSPLNARTVTGSATLGFTSGGSHSVQVTAVDDYGQAVAVANFQVVVYEIAPTLQITAPAAGSILYLSSTATTMNVPFAFRTTSQDPFKVTAVGATIDGNPVAPVSTPNLGTLDAISTGTFANLGVGSHTFAAKALLTAQGVDGVIEVSNAITFEIRRPVTSPQPPTVVIDTPPENSTYTRLSTGPAISIPLSFTGTSNATGAVITQLTAKIGTTALVVSSTTLNQKIATGTATISVSSAGTHTITVTATDVAGTAIATRSFTVTVLTPKTVCGKVFFDVDYDGAFDAAEFGLEGIAVKLLNGANQVVATGVTGAGGSYSFPNIAPGDYVVSATAYAGLSATNANERTITVDGNNVTVPAIGFGLNFAALRGMKATGSSHGFWKNNVDKAIANKSNGAQVSAAKVKAYTDLIADLALSPYDGLTMKKASAILSSSSSKVADLLSKQLVASEYNYAHGAYIDGNKALTYAFVAWGEQVLKNSSSYSSAYVTWTKNWFDAYNNSYGGVIAGPAP